VLDVPEGPVGPNNNPGAYTNWNGLSTEHGDADLDNLSVPLLTFDAVVLEFDFIPQGDTVEFQYIFASEEYEYFEFTDYNDVFAFFISGPGISGGVQNLAVVPGTSSPINISNINGTTNSSLYNFNGNGVSGPQYTDSKVVQFNGFTVPLTAISKVTPCKTYHLKIAIADVGDGVYDSGVFLKGGSLSSSPRFIPNQNSSVDVGTENLLPEGCSNGILELKRTEKLWSAYNLNYRIYGSAQNGIDYTTLSGTVSFPPNVSETSLDIIPVIDGIVESDETVILRFPNPYVCETDSVDYIYTITDLSTMSSSLDSVESVCPGDKITINANFNGGYSPYTYLWNTGAKTVSTSVFPNSTTDYDFSVSDVCGSITSNGIRVKVPDLLPLSLIMLPKDTAVICLGVDVNLNSSVSGGAIPYRYSWSTGEKVSSISPQILESKVYDLKVTDACGNIENGSSTVQLDYPELKVEISKDTVVCPGDLVMFIASAQGGYSPYSFVWENGDVGIRSVFSSLSSRTVNVSVTDSCGIIPSIDSAQLTIQKPIASFVINSPLLETNSPIYFIDNSEGFVESYDWDFGNGEFSNIYNPTALYEHDSTYKVQLTVTDSKGCKDSINNDLKLTTSIQIWVPNAFSPNIYKDDINSEFLPKGTGIKEFKISVYNRWGTVIFSSFDINEGWDGTFISGKSAPSGVYIYKISVTGVSGKKVDKVGSLTLYR
jgi:gliding motility-associated-like protein